MARTSRASGAVVPLSEDERAFWLAFHRANLVVPRALDADLLANQGISLSEYVVLMRLSEAPERSMRMSYLAASADLSLSGMTRLVARLGADGLVDRVRTDIDGRGACAVLTDAGFDRLTGAYPDHLASVRRAVLDHLSGFNLKELAAAFNRFGPGCPEEAAGFVRRAEGCAEQDSTLC